MSSDSAPRSRTQREDQPEAPPCAERCNALILSLLSLCLIGFGVWLVYAGRRYRQEYAQVTEGWHVGGTRMVELTLVGDDKRDLACASDQVVAGLSCGYRGDLREAGPLSPGDPTILQPYNTITNELFLAAGLWNCADLKDPLPQGRFTVACNYHVMGVIKSGSTRFGPEGSFSPIRKTVTVGTLTDCVVPR